MTGPTYAELMRLASQQFREAGIDAPRQEARRLMLFATGFASAELVVREVEVADPDHRHAFEGWVQTRVMRVPLAHIEGWTSFFGHRFRTDDRALIPRADSESVVELALQCIPEEAEWTVADLGTGTGALLASILISRPNCEGVAVERSHDALLLAHENFEMLDLSSRVASFQGSWREWTSWVECDLIVSNPPYIRNDVIPTLAPEVRDHDPMEALDGGADGLDAYREIISLGAQHMKPGAHLVLEIGYDQKSAVSDLLTSVGFSKLQHRKDLGGNDRAIAAIKT